jgi:hypothetical protein
MSNPIADTADYFARWKQISQHLQDQGDDEPHPPAEIIETTTGSRNINSTAEESTRSQWLRVLNRISFLNPIETPQTTNEEENDLSDDDSVIIDRDTFELMRSAARQQSQQKPLTSRHQSLMSSSAAQAAASRHHSLNVSTSHGGAIRGRDDNEGEEQILEQEEEEKLPSADDLENDHIYPLSDHQVEDEESNYFTHPFKADTRHEATPTLSNRIISEEERQEESRGKDKWDRTLDKLKLIANLQSSNTTQPILPNIITGPSHTLATYYPPAFDPIFAAFAKDEYGRKLVRKKKYIYIYFV